MSSRGFRDLRFAIDVRYASSMQRTLKTGEYSARAYKRGKENCSFHKEITNAHSDSLGLYM